MPQAKTIYLYSFDELDDSAKETAREWYRNGGLDYKWWDEIYDDAKECGQILGISIDNIYFSGFWNQGDGACFEGSYTYAKSATKAIREHAPQNTVLHDIADALQTIQRPWFYSLEAQIKHSGRYAHEYSTDIDVSDSREYLDSSTSITDTEEALSDTLRDFMRWIYSQLETEYNWLNSDEQIDESMRINEYRFNENGTIY
jgi:hypothetical protein